MNSAGVRKKEESMTNIIFKCDVITPLFISGADPHVPELRAPSIKGVFRFWWRALNGHLSLDNLKQREATIFGAADEKIGKSKVILRIKDYPTGRSISKSLRTEITKSEYEGTSYLLYSVLMLNERPYFKAGTTFELTVSITDEEIIQDVLNTLAVFNLFGALSALSRRGAGSLRLYPEDLDNEYSNLFYFSNVKSKEDLKDFIKDNIKPMIKQTSNSFKYSLLNGAKVYIMDPKDNWKDALESIGEKYKTFRNTHVNQISNTPNFGFPVFHRNRNTLMGAGPKNVVKNNRGNVEGFLERRSSPLIFKILKINDGLYFPLIIWLNGELIPTNYKIMDKKGGNQANPSNSIIQDFLNTIPNKMGVVL